MTVEAGELPLVARARQWPRRPALIDPQGTHTYGDLLRDSGRVAGALLAGAADLLEERIAYLLPPGVAHAAVQWGIWRAGGVAVPLALSHPPAEWEYILRDARATALVAAPEFLEAVRPVAAAAGTRVVPAKTALGHSISRTLPRLTPTRRALMVYTSGTTGRPKGVVATHAGLAAQVASLVEAWEWTADDRILLVLPLHHVHGIVNVLTCALWSGAVCEAPGRFDPDAAWDRLASGDLTLFMAVPTIYHRLIAAWEVAPEERRAHLSAGARGLRLMVSGSAALPVRTLERWREITGHTLLERYGMTEIGMALSNPLRGERRPGSVGTPLPGVAVRLVDDAGTPVPPGTPGELEVRGPTLFLEYWRRPDETRAAFRDGWFRTGDVGVWEGGTCRLLGRSSVDIIKTGGYKVSALEIEEVLRTHPAILECAVVGVPDAEWGERIGVAAEVRPGHTLGLEAVQAWARARLAPYKLPRALAVVPTLPRNAMGKVLKPELGSLFAPPGERD
jgi:malonyl-CoA/methylmalonyl-CoA synthetase